MRVIDERTEPLSGQPLVDVKPDEPARPNAQRAAVMLADDGHVFVFTGRVVLRSAVGDRGRASDPSKSLAGG